MAKPKIPSGLEFYELREGAWFTLVSPISPTRDKLKDLILQVARPSTIISTYDEMVRYSLYRWETEVIEISRKNEEIETYKKTKQDRKVEKDNPDSDVYPVVDYLEYPTKPLTLGFTETAHATLYRQKLKDSVNQFAGDRRQELVSQGHYIVEEYRLAADHAKAWLKDGGDAPRAVTDWADIHGMDYEDAANKIIAQNKAWVDVLLDIRKLRLECTAVFTMKDEDGNWVNDLDTCWQTYRNAERQFLTINVPE